MVEILTNIHYSICLFLSPSLVDSETMITAALRSFFQLAIIFFENYISSLVQYSGKGYICSKMCCVFGKTSYSKPTYFRIRFEEEMEFPFIKTWKIIQ